MGYVKNSAWVNGDASRPLNADRMNHIEDGVFLGAATADSAAASALAAQNAADAAQAAADAALPAADLDADTAVLVGDTGTATGAAVTAAIDGAIALSVPPVRPSSLIAVGTSVALFGDSITNGAGSNNASVDSYRAYLPKITGTARVNPIINGGVDGDDAGDLLLRVPALLAQSPAAVVLQIGTNPSTDLATFISDYQAILDLIQAAKIPVVINTLPPRAAAGASEMERTNTYNLFIRSEAARRNIPIADVFAALVDPVTGFTAAAYAGGSTGSDATHPSAAGHLKIAQTVAPVLLSVLPSFESLPPTPYAPNLIGNPLMAGGTASTLPTGWASGGATGTGGVITRGTEAPVEGDGLRAGDWLKVNMDGTAASGTTTVTTQYNATGGTIAAGSVYMVEAFVKFDGVGGARGKLNMNNGGTVLNVIGERWDVEAPGRIRRIFTALADITTPRVQFVVTALIGENITCYLGEVAVYNLTALGLADVVT